MKQELIFDTISHAVDGFFLVSSEQPSSVHHSSREVQRPVVDRHLPCVYANKRLTHHARVIMALQSTDALNRTFADLKSKSEDVRLRAAYDLYRLVATASRGMLSYKSRILS